MAGTDRPRIIEIPYTDLSAMAISLMGPNADGKGNDQICQALALAECCKSDHKICWT